MSPDAATRIRLAMRKARDRASLTQKEWGALLGVTIHTVQGWEKRTGGSPPTIWLCLEAARKLRDGRLLNEVLHHTGFRCEAVPEADGERERRIQEAAALLDQARRLLDQD